MDVKATAGVGRLDLLDHLPDDLVEIACAALDGHPTTEAGSREVEELVNHPRHAVRASGDAGHAFRLLLSERSALQEGSRTERDRGERVPKVVAHHTDEQVANPISLVLFSLTAILQGASLLLPLIAAVLGSIPPHLQLVLLALLSRARIERYFARAQLLLAFSRSDLTVWFGWPRLVHAGARFH
jgi:hypothetical protein